MIRKDEIKIALRNQKTGSLKITDVGICVMCPNFAGGKGTDNLLFCSVDCEDDYRILRQEVENESS